MARPVGHQGYFIMDDSWFDQYMYEVAVRKEYLPEEYQKALETEPEVLPYWNTFNPGAVIRETRRGPVRNR